jgi:hypothetical protein
MNERVSSQEVAVTQMLNEDGRDGERNNRGQEIQAIRNKLHDTTVSDLRHTVLQNSLLASFRELPSDRRKHIDDSTVDTAASDNSILTQDESVNQIQISSTLEHLQHQLQRAQLENSELQELLNNSEDQVTKLQQEVSTLNEQLEASHRDNQLLLSRHEEHEKGGDNLIAMLQNDTLKLMVERKLLKEQNSQLEETVQTLVRSTLAIEAMINNHLDQMINEHSHHEKNEEPDEINNTTLLEQTLSQESGVGESATTTGEPPVPIATNIATVPVVTNSDDNKRAATTPPRSLYVIPENLDSPNTPQKAAIASEYLQASPDMTLASQLSAFSDDGNETLTGGNLTSLFEQTNIEIPLDNPDELGPKVTLKVQEAVEHLLQMFSFTSKQVSEMRPAYNALVEQVQHSDHHNGLLLAETAN